MSYTTVYHVSVLCHLKQLACGRTSCHARAATKRQRASGPVVSAWVMADGNGPLQPNRLTRVPSLPVRQSRAAHHLKRSEGV
jgi:hypothetical protein